MKRILLLVGVLCLALYTGGVGHGAGGFTPHFKCQHFTDIDDRRPLTAEAVRQDSLEGKRRLSLSDSLWRQH